MDVHARDTVTEMIKLKVSSLNEFEWTKQLRFYWEPLSQLEEGAEVNPEDLNCRIKQTNAQFNYGFEY